MASVEIIGLLCAGSTRYHQVTSKSSVDKLSRSELAGLLATLGRHELNYALAKYAMSIEAERMLIAYMRVWAAGMAVENGWHVVKGRPTVVNMAAIAVFESVRPNRCYRCEGRGIVSNKVCPVCDGSGYKALSGRKIAEAIGVDESNYRRIWRYRYNDCYSHMQAIDSSVNEVLMFADHENNNLHSRNYSV